MKHLTLDLIQISERKGYSLDRGGDLDSLRKWLREEKRVDIIITPVGPCRYSAYVPDIGNQQNYGPPQGSKHIYDDWYEALRGGLMIGLKRISNKK